ncbi:histidinol phosphatase [Alkalihalobacillus alcalophilus ATCC 27647 = CGMCC 1.3604]|uniref:D,D-heptose 1,7-bisphosphate phosphatase n=1 Tax=Alkalihalobacillus alcalophilus ATCC 27647 = CGMCC 1.3604 TaxID=1218173 RepID=A0A094WGU6_ALKAL|nr:HAD family hydrolase [Alkalihalobacillus alcalophilus]KGA96989.1 histidinol phosphatase [Alkalihalobacillus alcalophilus ATCC 27647 = CGMCC 1.3604]MED1564209.1 HAD family hydrolase [Alkalihalobacillus alcalophilus]THG90278.1 histidinol phosphatase [Alkalihalobacillus alcalophilus ATCC 27647 = CGMCC 1.3604]
MRQAVFLDRDGVINEVLTKRVKFVNTPVDFLLLDGVGESIRVLNEAGFLVFIVTNQGGVGLGYMKEVMLQKIHKKMIEDLATFGASVDDIAYCPHKPDEGCPCRKPEAQMLVELAQKHQVDLHSSVMVGDRKPDIQAGQSAGSKTVLVNRRSKDTYDADAVFDNLQAALPWILQMKKSTSQ